MQTHVIDRHLPGYAPAYVANGVVGLRLGRFPLLDGTARVSGFVGTDIAEAVESCAAAPFPLAGDVQVGERWLLMRRDAARFVSQSYDMRTGEFSFRFDCELQGVELLIDGCIFASRTHPTLVVSEWGVTVDRRARITLRGGVETTGIPGQCVARDTGETGKPIVDGALLWEAPGSLSRLGIAYTTSFIGGEATGVRDRWSRGGPLRTEYTFDAVPGRRYAVRQVASLVPSVMHPEPDRQAIRLAFVGTRDGYDRLRQLNADAWADLWRGRVKIEAADGRWQAHADSSFFYLHSSLHAAAPTGPSPFGLGQCGDYHYYRGHVFWDADTFTFPAAVLTAPAAARAMLDYRRRCLPAARANAAMNGAAGLQFPWEAGPLSGAEVTPNWASHVVDEQHVSLDVAVAFVQYAHASGDHAFLAEKAWPVLRGVAEWVAARVERTGRGYEIRGVTGIDEGQSHVNNNGYTNLAAVLVLQEAVEAAQRLGHTAPPVWGEIASRLFLPRDPATGALLKHDAYVDDGGVCCPDPLAAFFPLHYRADHAVEQATFRYYVDRAESYIGYPMLSSGLGVFAAWLGKRDRSAELLEAGNLTFGIEPFGMVGEFGSNFPGRGRPPAVGPYLAHCGGFLMACMFGLTGVALGADDPSTWGRRPVILPSGWDGINVERLFVRGRPATLGARHGEAAARCDYHVN